MCIDVYLNRLGKLLSNKKIKSQQAAFNACHDDIKKAKDLFSWESIGDFLLKETGINFDKKKLWTMYSRAKKANNEKKENKINSQQNEKSVIQENNLEKKQTQKNADKLKEYLNACFNNERIADQAMNANISIETIKSWQSPNQIRLGNTLLNYIRNNK